MKMFKNISNSIGDFLEDIRFLLTNDWDKWENLKYEMEYSDLPCKCEEKNEVKDTDFYIEEWFDSKERKVKFTVYMNSYFPSSTTINCKHFCGSFDTFSEAKEILFILRKYKKPIIHYC